MNFETFTDSDTGMHYSCMYYGALRVGIGNRQLVDVAKQLQLTTTALYCTICTAIVLPFPQVNLQFQTPS